MQNNFIICSRCVLDTTVPDIYFDEQGICNYCKTFDIMDRAYPNDERGQAILDKIIDQIRHRGRKKKYDCIIGVSGGTDSTYTLYWAKKVGLRALAVHFDNGWNSEVAVRNIKNTTSLLNVDLYTYVVNWEEFKSLQVSFLRASIPDMEQPTDVGITGALYRIAAQEGIKYIIVGNNFRNEGKVPILWSYGDGRYIKSVNKNFGTVPLKTYPNLTFFDLINYGYLRRIKLIRPLWYLDYRKDKVKEILKNELGWEYYGGHHYESIYTRFIHGYLLLKKFNYDKRKVEYSAYVRTKQWTREEALIKLKNDPYPESLVKEDIDYAIKKLCLTKGEFDRIILAEKKTFLNYKTYYPMFVHLKLVIKFFYRYLASETPQMFYYEDPREILKSAKRYDMVPRGK